MATGCLTHWGRRPRRSLRIKTFTITDFRSIEKATVPVSDLTCLVGANNEGKSNILRAVVLATSEILEQPMRRGRSSATNTFVPRRAAGQTRDFVDRYDLPRGKSNPKPSVEIAFELTERDSECFERELGHKINDDLKINVDFRKPYGDRVQVKKRRSGGALTLKSAEIAGFIRDRVRLEYIPAVRTAEQAVDVVRRLVADQLGALRRDSKYIDVQRQLDEIERPIIESIEHDLQMSMAEFLPDVKAVEIVRRDVMSGGRLGRYLDIDVNDGVQTDLEAKGDGVQSLAAIALARTASIRVDDEDHHLILAIEEPETHLHPAAIRRLRGVLREISRDQQVILTTHSPLLIDTEVPSTNIIVEDQKARPARQVAEVRDCLGVAISDNLTSARLVVFVEGSGDARAFEHLLSKHSKRLNDLIGEQAIRFEPLHGASKLSARASAMRATACSTYAVLDGDAEGRQAAA